jgi:hypothetical protein
MSKSLKVSKKSVVFDNSPKCLEKISHYVEHLDIANMNGCSLLYLGYIGLTKI